MISNGEKLREARSEGRCHYLAVSKRSALSREISSIRGITKYHGNSYSLNCFHTFAKKKKNIGQITDYVKIKILVTL